MFFCNFVRFTLIVVGGMLGNEEASAARLAACHESRCPTGASKGNWGVQSRVLHLQQVRQTP